MASIALEIRCRIVSFGKIEQQVQCSIARNTVRPLRPMHSISANVNEPALGAFRCKCPCEPPRRLEFIREFRLRKGLRIEGRLVNRGRSSELACALRNIGRIEKATYARDCTRRTSSATATICSAITLQFKSLSNAPRASQASLSYSPRSVKFRTIQSA
jgi:hypothetical protein